MYGIYLGFSNESFYVVYNLNLSKKMQESQNTPKDASWLIKKIKNINNFYKNILLAMEKSHNSTNM